MIEYLTANYWVMWLVIAIVLLIVELGSGGFFIMCFTIGAIASAIISLVGGIYMQLIIFILTSAICVFLVRPFALKYLHRHKNDRRSNADAIIGRIGTVSQTIPAGGYGRVSLDGDDWKAYANDSQDIPVGSSVIIVGRESVIIKVSKFN